MFSSKEAPELALERTVGLIGLGQMGGAMCRTLRRAGWPVVAWDLSAAAIAGAAATGADIALDPADVGRRTSLILTSLPDAKALRAVTLGDHGICGVASTAKLVIDTSTTSPAEARDIARDLAAFGVEFLDAPVSGGVRGAETGGLSIMVGGTTDMLGLAQPVLETLGKIIHCGPVGAGQITKACNQLVVMATHQSVAEALVLAESSGLDPWRVREAMMAGYAASPILDIQGPRMLRHDFRPGGRARFHLKDIATIRELAGDLGLGLPAFDAAARQVERLVAQGGGDLDNSALITLIERGSAVDDNARPKSRGTGTSKTGTGETPES